LFAFISIAYPPPPGLLGGHSVVGSLEIGSEALVI